MNSRRTALIGLVIATSVALCAAALLRRHPANGAEVELPTLGIAPAFQLTDSAGQDFARPDLDGKIWIADFFFTNCQGPCPVMTREMAKLQQEVAENGTIEFVSFSVDPERDTPEAMAEYAARFGADTSRWHFLAGPIDSIKEIAVKGFKVGSVDDPVAHSTRFILVDDNGRIRGYYNSQMKEELTQLRADIDRLLHERQRG